MKGLLVILISEKHRFRKRVRDQAFSCVTPQSDFYGGVNQAFGQERARKVSSFRNHVNSDSPTNLKNPTTDTYEPVIE